MGVLVAVGLLTDDRGDMGGIAAGTLEDVSGVRLVDSATRG